MNCFIEKEKLEKYNKNDFEITNFNFSLEKKNKELSEILKNKNLNEIKEYIPKKYKLIAKKCI